MNISKTLNVKNPIINAKLDKNDNLIVVDKYSTIRIIETQNYKTVGGFKSGILHEKILGNHIGISYSGKIYANAIPKGNKVATFVVDKKKLLHQFNRHQGEIESVAIDNKDRYIATGGTDGKTFVWSIRTKKLVYSFPPHSDYVTTVCFDNKSQWIATGSFDRTIILVNMATMQQPKHLRGHNSAILKLLFMQKGRLISTDKTGAILIWDIHTGSVLHRLTKMGDEITALTLAYHERFMFVANILGHIALYDLETMEQLQLTFIKIKGSVSSLIFVENKNTLIVATTNGEIFIYNLFEDENLMIDYITNVEYDKAYALAKNNPLLKHSDVYKELEATWNLIVDKAESLFGQGLIEDANKLFDPFRNVPSKLSIIQNFVREFGHYATFKKHVINKKFSLAYGLAMQYPSFKETKLYKKMEAIWEKSFIKAKEVILNKEGDEIAREQLALFRGISQKAILIQELFNNRQIFMLFQHKMAKKEYLEVFTLINNNEFLKDVPEYSKLMNMAEKLYISAKKSFKDGNYAEAINKANYLEKIPDFKKDAIEIREQSQTYANFMSIVASKNVKKMYEFVDKHNFLYETKIVEDLEDKFSTISYEAEYFAAKGDISSIIEQLKGYFDIKSKYGRIATIIKNGYIVQLEQELLKKQKANSQKIENGVINYVKLFGGDDELKSFLVLLKNYLKLEVYTEDYLQGDIYDWTPKHIPLNIMEGK